MKMVVARSRMSFVVIVNRPFRTPVQWVNRPDQAFRGFSGRIVGGRVHPGDPIRVLLPGRPHLLEIGIRTVTTTITRPNYVINVNAFEFTGIDSPYETPANSEIHLDTSGSISAEEASPVVVEYLRAAGILGEQ